MGAGGGGGQGMGGGFDSSGSAGLGADAFDGPGISGAELAALDKEMFEMGNMMAQVDPGKHGTGNLNVAPHVNVFELGQHEVPYSNLQMDIGPFLGKDNRNRNLGLGLAAAAAAAAAGLYGMKDSNQDSFPGYGQPPSNPHAGMEAANQEGVEDGGMGQHSASSLQSLPNQSVVNQALNEANARNKTAARERAKALAKEAARLKAKEEHRIQVLKDREAKSQWNPNIVPEEEVVPMPLPPLIIDDYGPTTHEINVAKREATKARLATARGKTKSHLANLRKKGVSAKTMAKAKTKAKARYAKIKSR